MCSCQQIQGWSRLNTKILNWWRTSTEIGRGFLIGPSSSGEIYNKVITNWKTPRIDPCSATSSVRDFSGQISTSLTGPFPCSGKRNEIGQISDVFRREIKVINHNEDVTPDALFHSAIVAVRMATLIALYHTQSLRLLLTLTCRKNHVSFSW